MKVTLKQTEQTNTFYKRTLWKQPPMFVLNRRSFKNCVKSPEKHIFKQIPIAIFIGILQLNHFHKRHYLLFCTVYISILLCQRELKCRCWVGLKNKIGWLPYWIVSHKHLCGNGIRNKKFSLVFTSVVVPKTWGK